MMKKGIRMQNSAIKEFSRFAYSYNTYNMIQKEVAKKLISLIPSSSLKRVVDIGCGSGTIYNELQTTEIEHFIAIDSSSAMLSLHPSRPNVDLVCVDFNTIALQDTLKRCNNYTIISSSALQWCKDLNFTLKLLSQTSKEAYFAIFTSNTFKTLHQTADIDSPIIDLQSIKKSVSYYYDAEFEINNYRLEFTSKEKMFRYIKKSGVSGGEKKLDFKQTKALIRNYPLNYLEFEVLFVKPKALSKN